MLHGSFTAANAGSVLDMEIRVGAAYAHQKAATTAVIILVAFLLVRATQGRLGLDEANRDSKR